MRLAHRGKLMEGRPNNPLHLTGAAIPVSPEFQPVEAAPAGERGRSGVTRSRR
jgi:hypothetical protein